MRNNDSWETSLPNPPNNRPIHDNDGTPQAIKHIQDQHWDSPRRSDLTVPPCMTPAMQIHHPTKRDGRFRNSPQMCGRRGSKPSIFAPFGFPGSLFRRHVHVVALKSTQTCSTCSDTRERDWAIVDGMRTRREGWIAKSSVPQTTDPVSKDVGFAYLEQGRWKSAVTKE